MKIIRMKTNHLTNPLGYQLEDPTLSYVIEGAKPDAVKVVIASDKKLHHPIAEIDDPAPLSCKVPFDLKPRTRYYWQVTATTGEETVKSEVAWFETAKMDEPWTGKWMSPIMKEGDPHPMLTKNIHVREGLVSARAYIAGLGMFEFYINGEKFGYEYLLPGCMDYNNWIQYITFDMTGEISEDGDYFVMIALGNGWYKGLYGLGLTTNVFGDRYSTIAEIHLTYADGTEEVIVTDESWDCINTHVVDSGIYNGEVQDYTLPDQHFPIEEIEGWTDKLQARLSPPITIHERLTPIEIIHTPAGETVLDMGQNMVGWVEFVLRGAEPGHTVIYRTGEILQDGNFYQENLRSATSMFTFTSDGKERWVRPYFTFFGFRYVKLENWPGEIHPDDFAGCVIHSDMEEIGSIVTSDERINQLVHNVRWGQKGNFLDIPTDCPQRDERMGWTGDAQVFSGTASFNYDTAAFYAKYGHDMYYEQLEHNGSVPFVVPQAGYMGDGSTAWGEAATVIPWNVYLHYGDKSTLAKQYDSMKAWVDYMESRDKSTGREGLWDCDFHFADWLALDGPVEGGVMGGTDPYLISSCYYSYSSGLVAKAAHVLGKAEDEAYYSALSDKVKKAICDEYLTPNGKLAVDTMTGYVVMLYMDIAPEPVRQRLADRLAELIRKNGGHLKTGFVGTPYLCRVLSDYGYNDVAYTLLFKDDYPSWLYEVKMGATTIWERWNSVMPDGHLSGTGMNSLNHYAYGSIAEWIYRYVGGIRPCEHHAGFKRFKLQPMPDYRLPWVEVNLDSASGHIRSYWKLEDDQHLHVEITVPYESECVLILPDADAKALTELTGIGFTQMGTASRSVIGGGEYAFTYELTTAYRRRLTVTMDAGDVLENEEARKVIAAYAPAVAEGKLPFGDEVVTLEEMLSSPFAGLKVDQIHEIDQKLKDIVL